MTKDELLNRRQQLLNDIDVVNNDEFDDGTPGELDAVIVYKMELDIKEIDKELAKL